MKSLDILLALMNGKDACYRRINSSDDTKIEVLFKVNQGIDISSISDSLINNLPAQYVEFLSVYNGAELFNYDDIDGLRILSLEDVKKYTEYAKNTFEDDWVDGVYIFAKIIGEDNYLGFRRDDSDFSLLDCYFEELPVDWKIIPGSFDDFLLKYLDSSGDKFWIY